MSFPPVDCDGTPFQCGDSVQIIEVEGEKFKLRTMQVIGLEQSGDIWILTGLTPYGTRVTIKGVEHVRKCRFEIPQLQEGVDATAKQDGTD